MIEGVNFGGFIELWQKSPKQSNHKMHKKRMTIEIDDSKPIYEEIRESNVKRKGTSARADETKSEG